MVRNRTEIPQPGDLPAGFGDTRDQAIGGMFTEGHTRHLEAAEEGAPTTGDPAAVDQTGRAGITRKQGQSNEVAFCLQLFAELGVFRDGFRFAFVSFEPAGFCHKGRV